MGPRSFLRDSGILSDSYSRQIEYSRVFFKYFDHGVIPANALDRNRLNEITKKLENIYEWNNSSTIQLISGRDMYLHREMYQLLMDLDPLFQCWGEFYL